MQIKQLISFSLLYNFFSDKIFLYILSHWKSIPFSVSYFVSFSSNFTLSLSSHFSVSQALPLCRATIAGAASSASKAAPRTWARRMSLPTTNTVRWRRAKIAEAPCSFRSAATATVATAKAHHTSTHWRPTREGRGTALWTAMEWCRSLAPGLADGFCLRWK